MKLRAGLARGKILLFAVILAFSWLILFEANQKFVLASDLNPHFTAWKNKLWQAAKKAGIRRKTFNAALKNVEPNYKLPRVRTHKAWAKIAANEKIRRAKPKVSLGDKLPASCYRPRQTEFLFPTLYFPPRHIRSLVSKGQAIKRRHKNTFQKIEEQFGVGINVVLAIWGRETAYGQAQNRFNGIETWVSLAYAGPPTDRVKHQVDLLNALKFIDEGHIKLRDYKTSFAGATGYPQFTPGVFAEYAVDFDGDGRKNIWTSVPDAVASTANYLKGIGWQSGERWGNQVIIPKGFDCAREGPNGRQPVAKWRKGGIRFAKTRLSRLISEPPPARLAQFMAPAGTKGPVFLVHENFEVFRRYNKADLYALFVGHLSDRIGCDTKDRVCGFKGSWPQRDEFNFSRKRICRMQIFAKTLKASTEIPDGLFGGKTRVGIGTYEKNKGLKPTCFPSTKLLKMLENDIKLQKKP